MNVPFALLGRHRFGSGLMMLASLLSSSFAMAIQVDIPGPPGSTSFGDFVRILPNGNIVVVDKGGPVSAIGAVHLFSANRVLISTLTGSSANDQIGSGGIVVLPGGDFLVVSPDWDNPAASASDVGAVTWVDGDLGLSGQVSSANSLVGSTATDRVGVVTVLANGNYVVGSIGWDNGAQVNAGAATWGSGSSGITGPVTPTNSLVGGQANDRVGSRITVLANGNYVVSSQDWDNGAIEDAGAATWGSGVTGITGLVSTANSLVGTKTDDRVALAGSRDGVIPLSNGHYVVRSPGWGNASAARAGAATWGNGASGTVGAVSTANSIVGRTAEDQVGWHVHGLGNGNYVVISPFVDNSTIVDAGAITLLSGDGPATGQVGAANSLLGTHTEDWLGLENNPVSKFVELANGHFVVISEYWDNGSTEDAGAATWINGTTGATGTVSPTNSLTGTSTGDSIGSRGATALTNGNYVVSSSRWDNGAAVNAGAATWASGDGSTVGPVSILNSLIGTSANDNVGNAPATALANGHYVVPSSDWNNGVIVDAGAVTWGDGSVGITGEVSLANSLVGSSQDDRVGSSLNGSNVGVHVLANGNYVVSSTSWDDGALADVGAVTLIDGSSSVTGTVSPANSLIGTTTGDQIGDWILAFEDNRFAIISRFWDDGGSVDAGAVTLARGNAPITGNLGSINSVLGGIISGSVTDTIDYDIARHRLAVGRPSENVVSLLTLDPEDRLFYDGFE